MFIKRLGPKRKLSENLNHCYIIMMNECD